MDELCAISRAKGSDMCDFSFGCLIVSFRPLLDGVAATADRLGCEIIIDLPFRVDGVYLFESIELICKPTND